MTDNEKKRIIEWVGVNKLGSFMFRSNNSLEAVWLLNVLVEKGYRWGMKGSVNEVWFEINKPYSDQLGDWTLCGCWKPTIHEAIVAAVLQVIEKEAQDNGI